MRQAVIEKSRSIASIGILGKDINTYRKWFTPEMICSKIEIDHLKPNCIFHVYNEEDLREAFNWKNTHPSL